MGIFISYTPSCRGEEEKKMKSHVTIIVCLFMVFSVFADAQDKAAPAPKVDGTVVSGEYAKSYDFPPFTFHISRVKDRLFMAVSVKTSGWVAIGLGSNRMNGADFFMGNIENNKAGFTEQQGRGHSHGPVPAGQGAMIAFAVKEAAGVTTMEVECKAEGLIPAGAKEIPVLLSYSGSDSFFSYHANRQSVKVTLE
jgi:hypothetical protein